MFQNCYWKKRSRNDRKIMICNKFILIYLSLIVEQVVSLMINHAEILSWNQPVLNIRVMFLAQGHNGSL